MPRPRKDQQYRTPTYHAPSNRWRIRVGYHYSANDIRVETDHKWPHPGGPTGPCPPSVVAAAVAAQDQWRELVEDWYWISKAMTLDQPDRNWSDPVWVDRAKVDAIIARVNEQNKRDEEAETKRALHTVARQGFGKLVEAASIPNALAEAYPEVVAARPDLMDELNARWEQMRLQLMAEMRPILQHRAVRIVTIEQALDEHLDDYKQRVGLKTGRVISADTFNAHRDRLLCAFGLSASRDHKCPRPKLRTEVPFDVSRPLVDLDESQVKNFARFWQSMPEGVKSSRTVKNYLFAVRAFLKWCDHQSDYGWDIPKGAIEHLTADGTERVAVKYNPEKIKKVLACGRGRLKVYTLFGLLQGYYQKDIADVRVNEMFTESGERFVKRERSKESGGSRRKRKGVRKLIIKHWLAPEQVALIDQLHISHPDGLLLRNKHGLPLYRTSADTNRSNGVARAWAKACERAGVIDLPFSQLRKIGHNGIKSVMGREGEAIAEIWDGHSRAIGDHYDDGVFAPVIEAQRKWAEQLRRDGIL